MVEASLTTFVSPPASSKPGLDSPEIREAVRAALETSEVQDAIATLTAPNEPVRGCLVSHERAHLQALQESVRWTIGGYDTRPTEDGAQRKNKDRLEILLSYRQPVLKKNTPARVAMYDYLCHTIFHVPLRPVGPEVVAPLYQDESGNYVKPEWSEADWTSFEYTEKNRPRPVLLSNRYPYQLPVVDGEQAEHWVLWYLHFPCEPLANPSDEEIAADLREALLQESEKLKVGSFDYIWYRNPAMSVPDVFHVQVFVLFRGLRREQPSAVPGPLSQEEMRAKRLQRFGAS
mmetsp:Transcript_3034/g.6777  ORF Transcript_3034/g.6777 Transcript_3034/m.6777 type:complete len:289 (+) Transcript_3034:84-950(+)